jgi:hypothetical protein
LQRANAALVGSGRPLDIVASLLGHLSLDTTRSYTAVFPEQVIAAHEAFIERRLHLRPDYEIRPANGEERAEFEQHFLLRKVALGSCPKQTTQGPTQWTERDGRRQVLAIATGGAVQSVPVLARCGGRVHTASSSTTSARAAAEVDGGARSGSPHVSGLINGGP